MRTADLRWLDAATPIARTVLDLGDSETPHDLSAIARAGSSLFIAADEGAHLEIFHAGPNGTWGDHEQQPLAALFALPEADEELDIEGLAVDGGRLWIVGSHSCTRKKLKPGAEVTLEVLAKLGVIKDRPNRAFLGALDLVEQPDGRHAIDPASARMLSIKAGEDALKRRLTANPVLAPFVAIPAKENGLDIEGIAVDGARVSVGLRGPVVGGWACIIDLQLRDGGTSGLKIDGDLVHHWIDLDGLGVRDLKRDGDDLLILGGPAMAVSGPAAVYRWRDWAKAAASPSVQSPLLEFVLPSGYRCEHPEALLPWRDADTARLLVLVDSPHPSRVEGGRITMDAFELPAR